MALKTYKYDKETIFEELTNLYKDGYCNIKALPVFLFNDYRDIGILKCTEAVNKWITNQKIKHEQLCCIIDKHNEAHIYTKSEITVICLKANATVNDKGKLVKITANSIGSKTNSDLSNIKEVKQ